MSPIQAAPVNPLAAQLARLLCDGDREALEAAVGRWIAEAPDAATRRQLEELGARLVEIKSALEQMPVPPSEHELALQLTLMLGLAASSARSAIR